jgi:hypothetical protein
MRRPLQLGILVTLCCFRSAMAQGPSQISLLRVGLDEPTPKVQQLGEEIVFRIKPGVSLENSFHVRIFRGSLNFVTERMKAFADNEGCITYSTALLYGTANSAIHLQAMSDPAWLSRGSDGHFAPQDLVLVFEAGDQPTDTRIRLHKNQLDAYFRHGVPMQLLPSDDAKAASAQVVEGTQRALDEHRIKLAQLPPGPCYNVEPLSASDDGSPEQVFSEVAVVRPVSCGSDSPTTH